MEHETNYKGDSFLLVVRNSGSVWLEGWKSGRIENGRRIEKILFSLIFVWLGVEKSRDEKNEFE